MSRLLSLYTTSEYALPFYSFSQIAEKGLGITFFAGGSTSAIMMNSSDSVIRKLVNESLEKGAAVRNNVGFREVEEVGIPTNPFPRPISSTTSTPTPPPA